MNTKIKGPLPAEIKEKLEELGYVVTLGNKYNESWTSIEWGGVMLRIAPGVSILL